jgi:uncharacterized membrane protein
VEEVVTINATADRLFTFWRKLDQLPRFMDHLSRSIRSTNAYRTGSPRLPAGEPVEWDAEVISEIPGELIGWRTLEGADVVSAGSVRFKRAFAGRGHRGARAPPVRPAGGAGSVRPSPGCSAMNRLR